MNLKIHTEKNHGLFGKRSVAGVSSPFAFDYTVLGGLGAAPRQEAGGRGGPDGQEKGGGHR